MTNDQVPMTNLEFGFWDLIDNWKLVIDLFYGF